MEHSLYICCMQPLLWIFMPSLFTWNYYYQQRQFITLNDGAHSLYLVYVAFSLNFYVKLIHMELLLSTTTIYHIY